MKCHIPVNVVLQDAHRVLEGLTEHVIPFSETRVMSPTVLPHKSEELLVALVWMGFDGKGTEEVRAQSIGEG